MAYVPSAERYGFSLRLNEPEMRALLNSPEVARFVGETGREVQAQIVAHVQATASPENAANYVESMFVEDAFSDEYGFEFGGPYGLGDRPIAVIGVPAGRGVDPAAKPPMQTEADHHSLTSPLGVTVAGMGREDIR